MVDELATRAVPWAQAEFSHARNRPARERPPLPQVGDRVLYRRYDWHHDIAGGRTEEPELVTVVEVQNLADRSDPNLWHEVRDSQGQPVTDAGVPRFAPVADPWPWIRVRRPDGLIAETRESRIRGAAGWLPLDWRGRPERWRLPGKTLLTARPPLPPLNVPGQVT